MFGNRSNQIFTLFSNTELYRVLSGIDQGEILSLLLWCIYYDPLLCRIQNSELGYSLTHSWKPNVLINEVETNSIKIATLAYMDDTLWIAKSQEDLSQILNIADKFYKLNFIKVNWDKSVLLINHKKNDRPFSCLINDKPTHITPLSHKESTRYLGVWISLFRNKTYTYKMLSNEIKCAITVMLKKKLTDK